MAEHPHDYNNVFHLNFKSDSSVTIWEAYIFEVDDGLDTEFENQSSNRPYVAGPGKKAKTTANKSYHSSTVSSEDVALSPVFRITDYAELTVAARALQPARCQEGGLGFS